MSTKLNLKLTGAAAAMAVFAALALGAASADESDAPFRQVETHSIAVHYADLELTRAEGVDALRGRLTAAAKRVCGDYDRRDARARQAWQQCYDTALTVALAKVGSTPLAAIR